ncbi:pyridoxamine 5'-phosphate oxidase family protein [Halostella pelagica]|uniref:pyridoxamine 5'-phosphate oxidase family protein n=1 Tax=Halostella pelagica TaxID=2583824 RepID=UPI001080E600|nr:pyridoxamine 5'-phosphate oxidase family protein [Halostella pelagica]
MTTELSRAESETLLCESGVGVLALTDGTEAYSIPESFGYDGETLYFQFVYTPESKKMAFLETTETATFTVYEEQPAKSVIVSGTLEPVPEDEEPKAATAITENASIPTLNVYPDTTPDEFTMDYYRLTPNSITGRQFNAFTPRPNDQ